MTKEDLFGGIVLSRGHFDSDVAKAIFNDKGEDLPAGSFRLLIETRLMTWLKKASPKVLMLYTPRIDGLVVPSLSPATFREFCLFLCETLPQAIDAMPNTQRTITALCRAIHLSRCINPAALDRVHIALRQEGLLS